MNANRNNARTWSTLTILVCLRWEVAIRSAVEAHSASWDLEAEDISCRSSAISLASLFSKSDSDHGQKRRIETVPNLRTRILSQHRTVASILRLCVRVILRKEKDGIIGFPLPSDPTRSLKMHATALSSSHERHVDAKIVEMIVSS